MIFISHTYKDKPIVEPIAQRLAEVYGMDKVFYDSWSIQPGDGIIDRMNTGLAECKFFFFFVSKNSLQSNMVKLEWQNAIIKATNAEAKIIPVKIDDCLMPTILLQTLYIDVFGRGLEDAIRQMIDVINGRNTYSRIPKRGFTNRNSLNIVGINLSALARFEDGAEVTVEILMENGIVKNPRDGVKILGNGELTKKLNVKANAFSEGAKAKIEALGGTAEVI